MPKLSVSIPDELWQQATELAGASTKASQIIQDALRHEVGERQTVPANLIGGQEIVAPDRFKAVLASVRADALDAYRSGYERGLEYVEVEGYRGLRYGRTNDWEPEEVIEFADVPDAWDEDTIVDLLDRSNEIFRDGFVRALKDCWEAIRSQSSGSQTLDDSPDTTVGA